MSFIFSSDMQLCKPTFPFVSLWVSLRVCEFVSLWVCLFVSYAEMSPKNAFFYKNIIRNDELRKLTFEDFFFTLLLLSQMIPKELFVLPYKILWSSTIGNILILYLRIFFQNFFFQFFFSNVPNENGRSFVTFHMSLFL